MKFLKSQGIVIVLALVAVILVGKNLVWPFLKPKFASRPAAKMAGPVSVPSPVPAAPPQSAPQPSPAPVSATFSKLVDAVKSVQATSQASKFERMNAQGLKAQSLAWVASPQRDPFKRRGLVSEKSAKEQLTLTGILRQTDSDLAVINNQVIATGEMILGFKIETVESDRVWVSGPNGREEIGFKFFVEPTKPQEEQAAQTAPPAIGTATTVPGISPATTAATAE